MNKSKILKRLSHRGIGTKYLIAYSVFFGGMIIFGIIMSISTRQSGNQSISAWTSNVDVSSDLFQESDNTVMSALSAVNEGKSDPQTFSKQLEVANNEALEAFGNISDDSLSNSAASQINKDLIRSFYDFRHAITEFQQASNQMNKPMATTAYKDLISAQQEATSSLTEFESYTGN